MESDELGSERELNSVSVFMCVYLLSLIIRIVCYLRLIYEKCLS